MTFIKNFILRNRSKQIARISCNLDYLKFGAEKFQFGAKILDIGAGSGHISEILSQEGFKVMMVDTANYNQTDLPLTIYDGKKLPFRNGQFDFALLVSVLHHCTDPKELLKEAKRVAKKVIILEDTVNSFFDRLIITFIDNLDKYLGYAKCYHIHNYLSNNQLKKIISDCEIMDFKILWNSFHIFKRVLVVYQ